MSKYGELLSDESFPAKYQRWRKAGITEELLEAADEFARLAPDKIDDNGLDINKAALARFYGKGARDVLEFLKSFSGLEEMRQRNAQSLEEMEFGAAKIMEADRKGTEL